MVQADPYSIRPVKQIHQDPVCISCKKRCNSCINFVNSLSSSECFSANKVFKIRNHLTCTTHTWYDLHTTLDIVNKVLGLQKLLNLDLLITSHKSKRRWKHAQFWSIWFDCCSDTENPSQYLRFILIDCLTNIKNKNKDQTDDLFSEKENFWIGTLSAIHKGLNDYNGWKRIRRNQKFNITDC